MMIKKQTWMLMMKMTIPLGTLSSIRLGFSKTIHRSQSAIQHQSQSTIQHCSPRLGLGLICLFLLQEDCMYFVSKRLLMLLCYYQDGLHKDSPEALHDNNDDAW